MGNFDQALRAPFAQLYVGGSVAATIALESDEPAPPIIVWKGRVFRQAIREVQTWRYDEVDALFVP